MSGPMLLEVDFRSCLDERLLDAARAELVEMILRSSDRHAYRAGLEAFRRMPPEARRRVELAVETELAANGVPVPPCGEIAGRGKRRVGTVKEGGWG